MLVKIPSAVYLQSSMLLIYQSMGDLWMGARPNRVYRVNDSLDGANLAAVKLLVYSTQIHLNTSITASLLLLK